jgi:hypothetical protein
MPVSGEPPQLGLPQTIGTTEVTQLVANVSAIYSPELRVGFTPVSASWLIMVLLSHLSF